MLSVSARPEISEVDSYLLRLSSTQIQTDELVGSFASEAANPYNLAGMLAGNYAYRFVKLGALSGATKLLGTSASFIESAGVKAFSTSLAFSSEVFAFEGTQRVLKVKLGGGDASLLKWEGANGIQKGLFHSALSFGSLKMSGALGSQQNFILQHVFADTAVVASHQMAALLSGNQKPQESIAEQFVFAEITQLQMLAGMSLVHSRSPQPLAIERAMELELKSRRAVQNTKQFVGTLFSNPLESLPLLKMSDGKDGKAGSASPPALPSVIVSIDTLSPGDVIGERYQLGPKLGQGGMGVVFEATHIMIGKRCAIKILRPEFTSNKSVAARFLAEARAATAIHNPHIIDITDFGQLKDGSTYFVMEHLQGYPLLTLVESGTPVPLPRIVNIALQLTEGLAAAHEAGIVHRDLKPDNIFLVQKGSQSDFVKILDFGIAKVNNAALARQTMNGEVFGTPQYMSPEQALGIEVDHRSDIYSLGVVLYELTSGRTPFEGESAVEFLQAQVNKEPPTFRELNPALNIRPEFEAIVRKCLSKKVGERYQTMKELMTDIERIKASLIQSSAQPTVSPQGPRLSVVAQTPLSTSITMTALRDRRPLYIGGGVGVVALSLLGAFFVLRKKEEAPNVLPVKTMTVPTKVPKNPEVLTSAAPSPTVSESIQKSVTISVEPSTAHIFMDNVDLGIGKIVMNVDKGVPVKIEVRKDGYITQKVTIDDSEAQLSIHLDPEIPPIVDIPKNLPLKIAPIIPVKPKPKARPKASGNPNEMVNPFKIK